MYTHKVHCMHCYNVIHPCELLLLKENLSHDAYMRDHGSLFCWLLCHSLLVLPFTGLLHCTAVDHLVESCCLHL